MNARISCFSAVVLLGSQLMAVAQELPVQPSPEGKWVRHMAQVAPVAAGRLAEFTKLTKHPPDELAGHLAAHGFRSQSIIVKDIAPGVPYAFRFVEYRGEQLDVDLGQLVNETVYRTWKQAVDNCLQSPWTDVEEVFYWHGRSDVSVPPAQVQYRAQIVGLRPEMAEPYRLLHAHTWPGVLSKITEGNIRDYAIFWATVNSRMYLFAYFEYVGRDFKSDMAAIGADPTTQAWIKFTDEGCQLPIETRKTGEWWAAMDRLSTVEGAR